MIGVALSGTIALAVSLVISFTDKFTAGGIKPDSYSSFSRTSTSLHLPYSIKAKAVG